MAPGDAIRSSYIGSTTATALLSGTSMSAPYVAGTVARYLSQVQAFQKYTFTKHKFIFRIFCVRFMLSSPHDPI